MGLSFPFGVMKMFWNQIEMLFEQHCERTKCHRIAHDETVNFMLYESQFAK